MPINTHRGSSSSRASRSAALAAREGVPWAIARRKCHREPRGQGPARKRSSLVCTVHLSGPTNACLVGFGCAGSENPAPATAALKGRPGGRGQLQQGFLAPTDECTLVNTRVNAGERERESVARQLSEATAVHVGSSTHLVSYQPPSTYLEEWRMRARAASDAFY